MRAEQVPSPFALGWARSLARVHAPAELSVRELFDRQLLIGLMVAYAGAVAVSTLPNLLHPNWADLGLSALFVLLSLGLVVLFLARGGRLAPYAHTLIAINFLVAGSAPFFLPPAGAWIASVWGLTCPILATLLTGVRGGLVWTGVLVADFALIYFAPRLGLPFDSGVDYAAFLTAGYLLYYFALLAAFLLLILTWFLQQREIVERLLDEERARARELLRRVMPESVASRLESGEVVADALDEVTVVFADLVGFTTLAAGVPARRVVAMLGELFGEIDRIADEEGVEKVKTIGDCYMAVVGAPSHVPDHADRALRFCSRVQAAMRDRECFGQRLQLRIGVHSGPVMAGIIGHKRLLYDLWGDTVNAASRLESTGVPGAVQVSEATLRLCAQKWPVEDRGLIQLRGRTGMRCFLLGAGPSTDERSAGAAA
jgi:guanylate cyclase